MGRMGSSTLHRPSNVDDPETLKNCSAFSIKWRARRDSCSPFIPNTRTARCGPGSSSIPRVGSSQIRSDYLDFLRLTASAKVVLTDSGGIQEESTVLGVRCLTPAREHGAALYDHEGTNILAGCVGRDGILASY